ncbi:sulfatase family protein [Vallitalea okinawensis]|uniref:sulfatase family protein n=1 Tax=Vallitalea okinawensis TaxID=2078660 RepID=UPI000CFAB8FE|nr:sulfatase [Vallitalea okinawensis]
MNIVYMHTHDTGRYIEPYGVPVKSPRLKKFAKEGTLFRNAYCAGPTCSPSRAGLLTGMSPHNAGMIGLAHRGFSLTDNNKHLVQYLKKHNYVTALSGIQHVAKSGEEIGYDYVLTSKEERVGKAYDVANAKKACEFIESSKEQPFFLSFGMWNTHREFPEIHKSINPDYVTPPYPLADTPENREDMAAFMSSLMVADECVGMVLDTLDRLELRDETLVIFTTDHGIAFPRMKCNLYDTGIGVSLIMDYKGSKLKGKASDALISHLDLFPTICDIANIEKPDWLQGQSMVDLFEGDKEEIREELFSEVSYHAAYEPKRCIRTKRYKLIKHYDVHDQIVPANIDDSPGKSFLIEHDYLEYKVEREKLFDLYIDPVERVNLVNDERYSDIYQELSHRLDKWMEETDDPLLNGQIPLPEGAVANKLSTISPKVMDWK